MLFVPDEEGKFAVYNDGAVLVWEQRMQHYDMRARRVAVSTALLPEIEKLLKGDGDEAQ